jgi:GTP-binding protein
VDTLLGAAVKKLPPPRRASVAPLKVAVVGRPNVGKSSYINRLLGSDRVIVSEIPGTTRDSIEIPFAIGKGPQARHYLLIDTAGMRKPGRVHNSVEKFSLFRAEQSIANADVVVLMLDAGEGPTEQDKKIAAKMWRTARAASCWSTSGSGGGHEGLPPNTRRRCSGPCNFVENIPVVFASAKSGFNLRKSIEAIDHVPAQTEQKLATGLLNDVARRGGQDSTAAGAGRRLKLFMPPRPARGRSGSNFSSMIPSGWRRPIAPTCCAACGRPLGSKAPRWCCSSNPATNGMNPRPERAAKSRREDSRWGAADNRLEW